MNRNMKIKNYTYLKEEPRCIKCGKELTYFAAYIPSMGEACMDCYIEAAKNDAGNIQP
jgi:NMD protein affecting ribosome stability and mRNA decay